MAVDLAILNELLDIDLSGTGTPENVNPSRIVAGTKDLKEIFEQDTLALCNRLNGRDFLLFGYPRIESHANAGAYSEYSGNG